MIQIYIDVCTIFIFNAKVVRLLDEAHFYF